MPYLNLDDGYTEHRKVDALSDGAFRLHTSALCYCARELTDGHVPEHRVARLVPRYRAAHLAELVASGLWLPAADGFDLHDYLDWNKPRAWWTEKREKDAKRLAEWRRRKRDENEGGNA